MNDKTDILSNDTIQKLNALSFDTLKHYTYHTIIQWFIDIFGLYCRIVPLQQTVVHSNTSFEKTIHWHITIYSFENYPHPCKIVTTTDDEQLITTYTEAVQIAIDSMIVTAEYIIAKRKQIYSCM